MKTRILAMLFFVFGCCMLVGDVAQAYSPWSGPGAGGALNSYGADLAGSTANSQWIASISGAGGAGGNVGIGASVAGFLQSGTGPANGTAASFNFNLQGVNATNGSSGAFNVNAQAPTGTGSESLGVVSQRGGSFAGSLGPFQTSGSTFSALYLGPGITPNASNYAVVSNGSNTTALNSTGGNVGLAIAGIVQLQVKSGDVYSATAGTTTLGATNAFNSAFLGGSTGSTIYTSIEGAGGSLDHQLGHVRHQQVFAAQNLTGTQNLATGAAGTLFCPGSNFTAGYNVRWQAKAPQTGTPLGATYGSVSNTCLVNGTNVMTCGVSQLDFAALGAGASMCNAAGNVPPAITIVATGGCMQVQSACAALNDGNIDFTLDITAIHD